MRALVWIASWAVLVFLGLLGWPSSPEVFFPRSNAGGWMMIGTMAGATALALMLLVSQRRRLVVLSGVVFVLGMLPIVGMFVELSNM